MDKAAVLTVLAKFRTALEARGIRVERLVLFGSYANGDWHEGSDIDVVVVSEDFNDKTYWQRIDVLTEAIYELFQPIEATALTPDEWNNRSSRIVAYAETGQVIFG